MLFKRYLLPVLVLGALLMLISAPLYAQDDRHDVYGRELPADAAPYSMQIWQELCNASRTETSLSSVVTVYARICDQNGFDKFGDSLVVLDENLKLIPGAAESWEVADDGVTWTFHLRPGQVWSDGTPLTAHDYVASYQYMVNPDSAYDFVWMWQGVIKGWSDAVAGDLTPEEVGVSAPDDNTFQVVTEVPFPPLPGTLFFWAPLQAKALAEHGPNYILDSATSVSSGPFVLREFVAGERLVLDANPTYNGYRKPWLKEIRGLYGDQLNGSFPAFQNHDVDRVNYTLISPADFEVIDADPVLTENYRPNFGDFRTDYLLFDTFNPPFDNHDVRLAFAKAVDRESIVANVIGPRFGIVAHSFLAPGFPASDVDGELSDIQSYDCPAAQKLLADAGYPGGEGFPATELKLRNESEAKANWFIATAASISECLGVTITVNNMDATAYMSGLLERPTTLQFGAVSYGMDYLDPANMLGVWLSQGRHSWNNPEFDELVNQANSDVGDPAKRLETYQAAEKILVEDVGGIFIDHRIQGDLFQPYVAGECFRPDAQGVGAWHWGNDWCWGAVYITSDVANFETYRTR